MTRVLYIEDHENQRDTLEQLLDLCNEYDVDVACDGEEAVKKTRAWHPDVVLMDMRVPERIDGLAAIRQMRDSPGTAATPIIVISAWGSAKHKEQVLRAGADAHFTKPVPIAELIAAINWHLGSRPITRAALLLAHWSRGV